MKVSVLVSDKYSKLNGPLPQALLRAATARGHHVGFYHDDVQDSDLVIAFTNNPSDLDKIHTGGKIGWWMNDLRPPTVFQRPKTDVSAVFLCNTGKLSSYADYYGTEAFYMPQSGHDLGVVPGRKVSRDAVFIGNFSSQYHAGRYGLIDALSEHMSIEVITGETYTKDQPWIYQQTPISLAYSDPEPGYTSNRLYNILASGGFCLTRHFPGIEDLFVNGQHLVWFNTAEEAVELAREYLAKPKKRAKIAAGGKALYDKAHTAGHRLDNMIDILSSKTDTFYGFITKSNS